MRGLIRSVAVASLGPLLVAVAASVVSTVSLPAESAPTALDAAPKDALPPRDGMFPVPKDALPVDAHSDAFPDAPLKKPDALPPPSDAPKPVPPDPTPLAADAAFVLSVKWNKGTVTIGKVRREKLPKTAALPRHLGRFAAELYSGPTLVERLRFDFPLIEDDTALGDTYAKGLDVTVEVKIPDSDRPNKLEIWDRATDRRWSFAYPPVVQ